MVICTVVVFTDTENKMEKGASIFRSYDAKSKMSVNKIVFEQNKTVLFWNTNEKCFIFFMSVRNKIILVAKAFETV